MALETRRLNFLRYAKIKVVGLEGGFMDPILEILCQGFKVCLGMFSIPNPRRHLEGGRTLGLVTRAVRAESVANTGGSESGDNHQRSSTVNILVPNQLAFVLGSTKNDDAEDFADKESLEKAHKNVQGSSRSDKSRGKKTDLTTEKNNLSSTEGGVCRLRETARQLQLLRLNNSFYAKLKSTDQIVHDLWSDKLSFKDVLYLGLGYDRTTTFIS